MNIMNDIHTGMTWTGLLKSSVGSVGVPVLVWIMSAGSDARVQLSSSVLDVGSRSLVMPSSTLYASPANWVIDLFCAFQPKRLIVPSFGLLLVTPRMPPN